MHSKTIFRKIFPILVAANLALPVQVFAIGDTPNDETADSTESNESTNEADAPSSEKQFADLKAREKALDDEKAANSAKIKELRKAQNSKNWYATRDSIRALEKRNMEISGERGPIHRKIRAGDRKYGKVLDKETQIADLAVQINKLNEEGQGKSPEEQALAIQKIQNLTAQRKALQDQVERKEKGFKRRVGFDMPTRCQKSDETFNSKTGKCEPKLAAVTPPPALPTPPKTANDDEKKKYDECYTRSDKPLESKVVSYYTVGKNELKKNPTLTDELPTRGGFEGDVQDVINEMQAGGYSKIWKVDAISFGSKVRSKTPADAVDLNTCRSDYAINEFFNILSVDHGMLDTKTQDFAAKSGLPPNLEIGPNAKPGEYAALEKKRPTDDEIIKVARSINASTDYTPVRSKKYDDSGKEYTEEQKLQNTVNNLKYCCSMNAARLKFQPYQFSEVKVYGAKFTPNTPECIAKVKQVATTVSTKQVDDVGTGGGSAPGGQGSQGIPASQGKGGKFNSEAGN